MTDRDLGAGQWRHGGANVRGTRRQKQERGAGHRDDRQRLEDGGWGKSPGGRRTTPVEDMGSG